MTRRPPARRQATPRPGRRRSQQDLPVTVLAVVAIAAAGLVVMVVNWLLAHWWLLLIVAVVAVLGGIGWWQERTQRVQWARARARALRYGLAQLDALGHRQFEYAIRDLMNRDGCTDAVQVGGQGDLGADVKATDPQGRRWVIQCKHRRHGERGAAVGTPELQVLNGTGRPVHKADVVVMVTNGRITQPGRVFARQQRLHLVDRQLLGSWAAGSRPLWELLPVLPPPRKPAQLS
ncbi:restriction endonuclease (plasmid) [Streptomyces sp. BB1-1-1]|uniref:restriction endonuclease n=1 Tax=Streptomyces sp. BB1-1-1 TaxID=3074430 RepID=UPI00287793E7|nr:restriction endonuclease [Streptomyces sp. BB1-1-1]WND32808.1 restriction endonuclease [Streptomyces sp. BB1-1-1]WND40124.1 restriction endonuclease [Streptomyces sp. BB1-1-1]WND40956.1 restriction endonuclease [Streptomyces sp. BB1-1-1]